MKIKDFYKNKKLFFPILAIALVIILAISALVVYKLHSKDTSSLPASSKNLSSILLSGFKITPVSSDGTGVNIGSKFVITCDQDISQTLIKSFLTVSPSQEYTLKKKNSREFTLSFDKELEPGKVYRFQMLNKDNSQSRSWAFQTKKIFNVVSSLPRDKGISVPLNSGIEITFSYEKFHNLDKYFEISPAVKGRFEYHKKTAVFVSEGLKENTVYTVTIKKGLGLQGSEDTLQQDYVFKFQTESSTPSQEIKSLSFSNDLYNMTSKVTPALEVYGDEYFKDKDINVEVFKYAKEDAFLENLKKYEVLPSWAYLDRSSIVFDTKGLEKVSTFQTKIASPSDNSDWWQPHYIVFPENLSKGYYLVNLSIDNIKSQAHIQVNDTTVSVTVLKNKTVVWANDSVSGNPIQGLTVETDGAKTVKTGKDGVALINEVIPVPENGDHYYFKLSGKDRPSFYALVNITDYYNYQNSGNNLKDNYWSYIYLDRGIYLPTDTVRIWGVVKPRDDGKPVKNATLELESSKYYNNSSNTPNIIASQELTLNSYGVFESEIKLSNLSPGNYSVSFKCDDGTIDSQYFEVQEYVKPAYKIDITPKKENIFAWEKARFDVQASFFEGSPVSGLKLDYNYLILDNPKSGKLTSDSNGSSHVEITPQFTSNSWYPVSIEFNVNNSQAEEQEVRASSSVGVFPRDTMIEINESLKGSTGSIEIKTSKVNLNKPVDDSEYWTIEDRYRGAAVNIPLTASIFESHWEKEETGDYYDFINKKVIKKYRYYEVKTLIKELSFTTVDGKYAISMPVDDKKSYSIEIKGYDGRNQLLTESQDLYFYGYDYYYSNKDGYTLKNSSPKDNFKLGDQVDISVEYNGQQPEKNPKAKYLFLTMKNGLMDYEISADSNYSFDFSKDLIPNVFIQAICFDGTNNFNTKYEQITYDNSEAALNISLTPDKAEYKPGDTVNIDILVKDSKNNPCKSSVNISAVDEAFYAIQDQYVDTLADLYYYTVSPGLLTQYLSYTPVGTEIPVTAEQGEGGDGQAPTRKDFKDNAFFKTVVTDSDGKAKVSFKLPDNLTSWRLTYQGVTSDMKAGSGKINIASKLPFFVSTIFNDVFMVGDTPHIDARVFGTELKSQDNIEYTVVLENQNGETKNFNAQGKGNSLADIPLGKLQEGDYTITVKAKDGEYQDALQRNFKVVQNILEASRTKNYTLSDGLKLDGGKALTTLSFYNKDSSVFYESLERLRYTWGQRVDQVLARKISSELMKKYYDEATYEYGDYNLEKFQTEDGGLALLSYDSSNPVLSAKLCSISAASFDTSSLRMYFYDILNNKDSTPENVAASYWGLATMGEPVLIDIRNLLSSEGIGLKEKLYLALALADIGDTPGAEEIYSEVMKVKSKKLDTLTYIDEGTDRDDILDTTALCSIIALKVDAPEKMSLFGYVVKNSTKDILTNLEQIMFIANSIPSTDQRGSFTYELNGKEKQVSINKAEQFRLDLTADQLSQIKFSKVTGNVSVTASFTGPVKDLMGNGQNIASISRTYSVNGKPTNNFSQSDLVKVTLNIKLDRVAPDGYYEVTDVLPAGMRPVSGVPDDTVKYYPDEISGQKIVFGFYVENNSASSISISYYARATSPGEFTSDNAVVKPYDSNTAGFSAEQKVTIGK